MAEVTKKSARKLKILEIDPYLASHEEELNDRVKRFRAKKRELLKKGQTLSDFASGHLYYGFHKVKGGWVYREWAPGATALHLIGDFNDWNRETHPLTPLGNGDWEIKLKGVREEGSSEMIDIIFNTLYIDFCSVYDFAEIIATMQGVIFKGQPFASSVANRKKLLEKTVEKFITNWNAASVS